MMASSLLRHALAVGVATGVATLAAARLAADPALAGVESLCGPATRLRVAVVGERVTVDAHAAPLAALLGEVAHRADVAYVLYEPLSECVTVRFEDKGLPEAIVELLRGKSFLLQYAAASADDVPAPDMPRGRLWVFAASGAAPAEIPPASGAARPIFDDHATHATNPAAVAAGERLERIAALAEGDGDAMSIALAQDLGDVSPAVRYEAAYALGEIGDATSAQLLKQALMDADRKVREAAIEAFVDIGGDASARALAVMLHDADAALREDTVYALADIGGAAAVELLEQARFDADTNVREAAVDLLAELADSDAPRDSGPW